MMNTNLLKAVNSFAAVCLALIIGLSIVQLGLRWNATDSMGEYTVLLRGSRVSLVGNLSQDWSGNFVIALKNSDKSVTFTPDRIQLMQAGMEEERSTVKLLVSLLLAVIASFTSGYFMLKSILRNRPLPMKARAASSVRAQVAQSPSVVRTQSTQMPSTSRPTTIR